MRWEDLFADLQGQMEAAEAAAEQAESASRTRAAFGEIRLGDRLRGSLGATIGLGCRGAGQVSGVLVDVGVDWLLLTDDSGRDVLVARRAVTAVAGLGRRTAPAEELSAVRRGLDLRRTLRALARDRAPVQLITDDGSVLVGTIDRVGADFVEIAEHPVELPRRAEAVRGVRAVVIEAVALVRTLPASWA